MRRGRQSKTIFRYLKWALEAFEGVIGDGEGFTGAEADLLDEEVGKVLGSELDVLKVLKDPLSQLLLLAVRVEILGFQDQTTT